MKTIPFSRIEEEHPAVGQRFEAKFVISELQAEAIRNFITPYVDADPYGPDYTVTSIYLDNPDLYMYRTSLYGEKNRYKLRVRYYNDAADEPVHFEVKQRIGRIILKHRALVHRVNVPDILEHGRSEREFLVRPEILRARESLGLFRDLMDSMQASPRVGVRYAREAYLGHFDTSTRITFDRHLECCPIDSCDPARWQSECWWRDVVNFPVVLEVKFTDTLPRWITEMVQRFELTRTSLAKYVVCVDTLRNEGIYVTEDVGGAV